MTTGNIRDDFEAWVSLNNFDVSLATTFDDSTYVAMDTRLMLIGYQAGRVAQPQWRPIAGGALPTKDVEVLCWWNLSFPPAIGLWNGRCWQDANAGEEKWEPAPTYWQPLPAPPETKL